MVNILDLVPQESKNIYRYEELNSDGSGTGNYKYLKYAPGTLTQEGTPINRRLLMAIQGFIGNNIVFNSDGSITETNADGDMRNTIFNKDGSITETFISGSQSITKTTTFNADGSISEVIS